MNYNTTAPSATAPATETTHDAPLWRIDGSRSEVRFTARRMGMTVRGRFTGVHGTLDLQKDQLETSWVDASIAMASVEPAMVPMRGLLLSENFLDAEHHPELRFRSELIVREGVAYRVHGELTFRGETRPAAFDARLVEVDGDQLSRRASIEARGRVDGLIADEELEIELSLVAAAATGDAASPTVAADPGAFVAPLMLTTQPARPVRLVGLVGSLRRGSLNRALMRAAREVAPDGVTIEPFELADLPFYDGDVEAEGDPAVVRALKAAIRDADGIVIATPEYNRGLAAVTKNAIDWASRPPFGSVLTGKPVLLLGATTGRSATSHALAAAADSLAYTQSLTFETRFGIPRAGDLVDDEGRLTDGETRQHLSDLLGEFARFAMTAPHQQAAA